MKTFKNRLKVEIEKWRGNNGVTLGCRFKQKTQKCPYQMIKETEESIERSKETLVYMEGQIKKLEKILKQGEPQTLFELEKQYHDGFIWREQSQFEAPLVIKQLRTIKSDTHRSHNCSYLSESCEDILRLKMSRHSFLRKKIMQMTSYYNELLEMLKALLLYHKCQMAYEEEFFISFQNSRKPCLVYFNLEAFKPLEDALHTISLFYFNEQTNQVTQALIKCQYVQRSPLLQGTHLVNYEFSKLFQVILPEELSGILQQQAMQGIEALVRVFNHRVGRRYGKIQGIYLWLPDYGLTKQKQYGIELGPMGYKVMGRMLSDGRFAEKQILIHLLPPIQ